MSAPIILLVVCAAVVMMRTLCQIATLSHKTWSGHQLEFTGLALAHALFAGGVLAAVLGWHVALYLIVIGAAGQVLFDRRGGK